MKSTDTHFDIYFRDLNLQAQAAFLEYFDLLSPAEANYDVFPIATIEGAEPELTELKLYSPLRIVIDEKTEYGDDRYGYESSYPELSPHEAACYEDEITTHFVGELSLDDQETRYGLMAYYHDNDSVKEKVDSIRVTTEVVDGQLMGVATLSISKPLSSQEMEKVKDYISGQYSDGFGEGAEQRPVKTDCGDMYVSLWNSDKDYFIKTEQEMDMVRKPKNRGEAR